MHQPVLFNEVLECLRIKEGGRYVDGTLGLGGHAEGILRKLGPGGQLLGIDLDERNLTLAGSRLQPFGDQTVTRRVNFRGLQEVLRFLGWHYVDGMIFDLGLSSSQLEEGPRGFSFQREGPLDMRLDSRNSTTALRVLESLTEHDLNQLFWEYGVRGPVKKLTSAIKKALQDKCLQTTRDLARLCEKRLGRRGKIHPATTVFLALRCVVNDEQRALKDLIRMGPPMLSSHGRMAIISFHSIEDRIVKHGFQEWTQKREGPRFSLLNKKPIQPAEIEKNGNPRSRSAKLRVLERIS